MSLRMCTKRIFEIFGTRRVPYGVGPKAGPETLELRAQGSGPSLTGLFSLLRVHLWSSCLPL